MTLLGRQEWLEMCIKCFLDLSWGQIEGCGYQRSWQRFGCSESEIRMLLKTGNCSND